MANRNKLTGKREAFAIAVATGGSLTDAYRRAYDIRPGTKAKSVWEAASRLASNDNVSTRIGELKAKVEERAVESIEAQRQAVVARLWAEATDPENPASCRIRALELLGRTGALRLFEEQVEVKHDVMASELPEILERKLRALLEGTVTDVSPQVSPVHSLGVALRVPAPEVNPHVSGAGLIRRVRPAVAPSAE